MAAVTDSMSERTGKSLELWVDDQNAVRKWLHKMQGVKQNSRWAIADAAPGTGAGNDRPSTRFVDGQYTGVKAGLRPIYDRIVSLATAVGDDVKIEGRSTYAPLVRERQFAAVQAMASRVSLGLQFVDPPSSTSLTASKGPGQPTHGSLSAPPPRSMAR